VARYSITNCRTQGNQASVEMLHIHFEVPSEFPIPSPDEVKGCPKKLIERGFEFGKRESGLSYGWNDGEWSLELPFGRYKIQVTGKLEDSGSVTVAGEETKKFELGSGKFEVSHEGSLMQTLN